MVRIRTGMVVILTNDNPDTKDAEWRAPMQTFQKSRIGRLLIHRGIPYLILKDSPPLLIASPTLQVLHLLDWFGLPLRLQPGRPRIRTALRIDTLCTER